MPQSTVPLPNIVFDRLTIHDKNIIHADFAEDMTKGRFAHNHQLPPQTLQFDI